MCACANLAPLLFWYTQSVTWIETFHSSGIPVVTIKAVARVYARHGSIVVLPNRVSCSFRRVEIYVNCHPYEGSTRCSPAVTKSTTNAGRTVTTSLEFKAPPSATGTNKNVMYIRARDSSNTYGPVTAREFVWWDSYINLLKYIKLLSNLIKQCINYKMYNPSLKYSIPFMLCI